MLLCVADAVHCIASVYSWLNRLNWLGRCICASALSHKLLLSKTKIIFIHSYCKLNNSVMQIKTCIKGFHLSFHFFSSTFVFHFPFPFPFPFLIGPTSKIRWNNCLLHNVSTFISFFFSFCFSSFFFSI